MNTWGIVGVNFGTAVCPNCGFEHHDDEGSRVDEAVSDDE